MQAYEENGFLTLKCIKEKVSSREGALEFKKYFSKWEKLIKEEGERLNFYTTIEGKQVLNNEDILIYASVLEIDNSYLEKFHEKLNDLYYNSGDSNYYYMYNDYSYYLMNLYLWDSIDNDIYNNTKNNNDSSNDGGFGGFSGGGDFSGGGGGDLGAF